MISKAIYNSLSEENKVFVDKYKLPIIFGIVFFPMIAVKVYNVHKQNQ